MLQKAGMLLKTGVKSVAKWLKFVAQNHLTDLNPLKKLASQTFIYGIPSIAGRFLNYLLTYLYTRVFSTEQFGVNSEFYAYSGFFTVLLAFGMETGFFRFYKRNEQSDQVYSTTLNFILIAALLFLGIIYVFAQPLADLLRYENNVEYIQWFGWILALDAVCAIPFARLRAENKPFQFAGIKVLEIVINVALNVFFLIICRKAYETQSNAFLAGLYNPAIGVGYIFIINLVASGVKMLLLLPQFAGALFKIDKVLLRTIVRYSFPMVLIGFAGVVNEMLDRMLLKYLLPYDEITNLQQLGIYGACYKLAVLMSLFIQAFRFAAEPFFFAQSDKADAPKMYAQVLKFFTIFCVFVFLLVMLYIDWFKLFIGEDFRAGLGVVPILLLANLFLGIYVNLSVWYKLTDRTLTGAFVSIGGAALTVVLNVLFIPKFGYVASAWATLACYGSMAMVSYVLGQKYYPVPYEWRRLALYIFGGLILWQAQVWLVNTGVMPFWFSASFLISLFMVATFMAERKNIRQSYNH
jgi:O-antigen/teichoic acid export membrane protein